MNLYLLRHGPAGDRSDWAPRPDHLRPLTKAGKRIVKKAAAGLNRMDLSLDVILTSPFERALQTAKIVAKTLRLKKKLVEFSPLASGGHAKNIIQELILHQKKWQNVLLVGHEPDLSRLISLLTTGRVSDFLELKKARLAHLVIDHPRYGHCAKLVLLCNPRLFS